MARILASVLFGACFVLCIGGPTRSLAEEIFKSIDAQGNVTYSAKPPPAGSGEQVQTLTIDPGPTNADQNAAHKRQLDAEQELQRNSNASAKTRQSQEVSAAQQALIQAKAELEQAKIQTDDDWQYLATGGRVLSQSYFSRIAAAEAQVEAREKALQQARQKR